MARHRCARCDLTAIKNCYVAERRQLLQWQEQLAEAARARVKARNGFSTLTGEQSHRVLRPLAQAVTDTTAEAIAPPLVSLKDPFSWRCSEPRMRRTTGSMRSSSEGEKPLIVRVDLRLRNREVATEAEVQALVDEIKNRLLEQVRAGARVRLL